MGVSIRTSTVNGGCLIFRALKNTATDRNAQTETSMFAITVNT